MAFGANAHCYGHIHDIVCVSVPKLCMHVHLGKANNIAVGCIRFRCTKKLFFIFRMRGMCFFVKRLPRTWCKIGPLQFQKTVDPKLQTIHRLVLIFWVSRYFSPFRRLSVDLVGSGAVLNCRCKIVFSKKFPKLIFRYTGCYFIIDPLMVSQNSTYSFERSRRPFWPHFEKDIQNSKKVKKM